MSTIDYDALDMIAQEQCFIKEFDALSNVFIPGEGDLPKVFIVGEAPGAQEEIKRRPFVGRSGRVLRQLMLIAHLSTEDWQNSDDRTYGVANCWMTNVVKFRPPRNRKPFWVEMQAARPYLRREWIAVGSPRVIVPVGGSALGAVVGRQTSILKHSGWLHEETSRVDGKPLYVWPMLHPSFGMREAGIRSLIEQDWINFGKWLHDAADL